MSMSLSQYANKITSYYNNRDLNDSHFNDQYRGHEKLNSRPRLYKKIIQKEDEEFNFYQNKPSRNTPPTTPLPNQSSLIFNPISNPCNNFQYFAGHMKDSMILNCLYNELDASYNNSVEALHNQLPKLCRKRPRDEEVRKKQPESFYKYVKIDQHPLYNELVNIFSKPITKEVIEKVYNMLGKNKEVKKKLKMYLINGDWKNKEMDSVLLIKTERGELYLNFYPLHKDYKLYKKYNK
jgi:hypothetical protein